VAKAPSSNLAPSITHTTSEISHATSVTDGQLIRDSEL
jgi:hypothetical protein